MTVPAQSEAARRCAATSDGKKGQKEKCSSAAAKVGEGHTRIQVPEGQVLPGSAIELREMANEAVGKGEHEKAIHLYTMAVDIVTKSMPRDRDGIASDADLVASNKASDGELARLLSNRSFMYVKVQDFEAAVEDADACTRADPTFEKGHLRLMVALEALGVPLEQRLLACENGLAACPESELLVKRKWQLKKALADCPAGIPSSIPGKGGETSMVAGRGSSAIEETRRLADDPTSPYHAAAAADYGASLAVGAHGLEKNVEEAERYLRIGAKGGESVAHFHLGRLMLESGRPADGAEELRLSAEAGNEQAAEMLQRLAAEAQAKQAEAREKLEALAATGDVRAIEMLKEFCGA